MCPNPTSAVLFPVRCSQLDRKPPFRAIPCGDPASVSSQLDTGLPSRSALDPLHADPREARRAESDRPGLETGERRLDLRPDADASAHVEHAAAIGLDAKGRIFLDELRQCQRQALLVRLGARLDRQADHRLQLTRGAEIEKALPARGVQVIVADQLHHPSARGDNIVRGVEMGRPEVNGPAPASIVEKETGRADERGHVAGVFINRLRLGMPLQTDPTIIYGLGADFDGNLRKRDLQTDGPFNTYLRRGLPPTPIAMPSLAIAARLIWIVSTGSPVVCSSVTSEAPGMPARTRRRCPRCCSCT